ncbi:MAG: glutaredoxin 3 [Planctomycetes bacterium]|nr:glutaredoxin 3 [Planctomycetota bacterium]MCP4771076.1 glutaredoxin 3 [Planctomycetota bacterium]MCP4861634.1 glutaredoxin 3 [Planctomycetota bacterium]
MAKIEIYSKTTCPYCVMAKRLFESKGQAFEEINLNLNPERTDEMVERAGGRMTVPEIFIDDKLIGGYDDLAALEQEGKLDPLLA